MVKSNKQTRPLPVTDRSSVSVNGSVNYMEHTYCVVLHVVEAINFYGREMREGEREQIIMNAALNTVDFEVEGTPSVTAETIIFNSNCIWECDMAGIKRIKTDHRPVKVTFFACSNAERKIIGSLLLPVRGLPVLGTGGNNSALQLKMFWHKLICISNEFRSHKPEVLLMLAIIKKSLLHTKDFKHLMAFNSSEKQSRTPPLQSPGHSITANMLQSQANVYVQSLVQLGLLQVGNDPLVDCDIIEVVLQFKQLKNLNKFVKSLYHGKDTVETVLLMFDFVGNVTNIDLKLNTTDSYTLNDVLGLRFKSSLRSIRLYFQRIFYLPINMYINGASIANYRMDFGKLLPPDNYFAEKRKYVHSGCFAFERFGRMGSARELKPVMEYTFTVDIQEVYWRHQEKEPAPQLQQELMHDEQVDLHSVGSKAVIREVPKDRPNENVVDWKRKSENHTESANGSVASLNVGAELSASDERDTASESLLSEVHDSDAPATVHTSQGRRKKFTRLIVNNPELDEDDELGEELTFASKVVSRKLSPRHALADEHLQDVDFMGTPDDIGSESEAYTDRKLRKNEDLRKHKPCNIIAPALGKQAAETTRTVKKKPKECDIQRSLKDNHVDECSDNYLRQEIQFRDHIAKRVDGHNIDDRFTDESCAEQEPASEKMILNVPKRVPTKRVTKSKPVEELSTQDDPRTTVKQRKSRTAALSEKADNMDVNCSESNPTDVLQEQGKSSIKKMSVVDDALVIKSKSIRTKKSATKTEELKLSEAAEIISSKQRKQVSSLKAATEKKLMGSQESLDAVEPHLDYDREERQESERQSRADLRKKSKTIKAVDLPLNMDMPAGTDEQDEILQRQSVRKMKSKPIINDETEVTEMLLTKKTSRTKKTLVSQTDLSLSARWVEVSRAQTKALEDTEQYIEATCNAQLDNTSIEEQASESPNKSTAKRRERSSRTSQRKNIEYTELNISSEMDPSVASSLVKESLQESKIERKVLKKKKSAEIWQDQEFVDPQKNSEMEPSIESSSIEEVLKEAKPKLRLKLKTSVESGQDAVIEPQVNHLRPKSGRAKEVIYQETEHVTSEMESLEIDANLMHKHEKKTRRVVKKSSLQNYLDAQEEAVTMVPQDLTEKPEQRLKKRSVKTTPRAPPDADLGELESLERKKTPLKKATKPDQLEEEADGVLSGSKRNKAAKSQLDLDALVSRLEVTVHMYDQTKAAAASALCVDQSVNTDITNMDASIKQILAAGKQLQNEVQSKTPENLDNLSQVSMLDNQAPSSLAPQPVPSVNYEDKFNVLEQHVAVLEQHLCKFESQAQVMLEENSKLALEKTQLKQRLANLENQIAQLRQQNAGGNELQQVLSEMRVQNVRFLDMTKSKDRYKKQWRRSAKRVHTLKLAMYEKTVQQEYQNPPSNVLNLKSILTQDADEFEREYGRFRRSDISFSFSSSGETSEPLLKDYLRGLSTQTVHQQRPAHHVDSSRMH